MFYPDGVINDRFLPEWYTVIRKSALTVSVFVVEGVVNEGAFVLFLDFQRHELFLTR